jgi:hypothetical protein
MPSDPAYISAFKRFTRTDLTKAELVSSESEVYGENDRARAVMLSAIAEAALDGFIKARLRNGFSPDDRRLLFEYNAPLGSLSAKTLVPYAFGMFGPDTRDDLDLIRTIRNGFAHCRKTFDFETPVVAAVCQHFKAPDSRGAVIPHGYLSALTSKKPGQKLNMKHPRLRFIVTCFTLAERLLVSAYPDDGGESSCLP